MLNPRIEILLRTHTDEEAELLRQENLGRVFIGEHELALAMTRDVLDHYRTSTVQDFPIFPPGNSQRPPCRFVSGRWHSSTCPSRRTTAATTRVGGGLAALLLVTCSRQTLPVPGYVRALASDGDQRKVG